MAGGKVKGPPASLGPFPGTAVEPHRNDSKRSILVLFQNIETKEAGPPIEARVPVPLCPLAVCRVISRLNARVFCPIDGGFILRHQMKCGPLVGLQFALPCRSTAHDAFGDAASPCAGGAWLQAATNACRSLSPIITLDPTFVLRIRPWLNQA
jgi:hypothetical protein